MCLLIVPFLGGQSGMLTSAQEFKINLGNIVNPFPESKTETKGPEIAWNLVLMLYILSIFLYHLPECLITNIYYKICDRSILNLALKSVTCDSWLLPVAEHRCW